jgi:hypothetical protein
MKVLFRYNVDSTAVIIFEKKLLIYYIILYNNFEAVQILANETETYSILDNYDWSAFHLTVILGNKNIVEIFLKKNIIIKMEIGFSFFNITDNRYRSLIYLAALYS